MFIGDKLTYLELKKTGCSHVRFLLKNINFINGYFDPPYEGGGGHNRIKETKGITLESLNHRLVAGNIRNPWSWYVSLWSYGCKGKGNVFGRLTRGFDWSIPFRAFYMRMRYPRTFTINRKMWLYLYSDVRNVENFRTWLKLILEDSNHRRQLIPNYVNSPIFEIGGLYNYEYFRTYTYDVYSIPHGITFKELQKYDLENNLIDHIIRMENLENDFIDLLKKCNYDISDSLRKYIYDAKKKQVNSSKHLSFRNYYDEETIALVYDMEKLIINKYGYEFKMVSS